MARYVIFRMNGVSNAFLRELNCWPCAQCGLSKPRANTSGSLIIKSPGHAEKHLLFDCGIGVVDSLYEFGVPRVDFIFNTHNHFDHVAGLDRLLNSLRRHPTDGQPEPIPFYATEGTWSRGIVIPYRYFKSLKWLEHRRIELGTQLPVDDLGIALRITAVPVYHGPVAYEPVIFVVEFQSEQTWKKIVVGWDLLHLVTRHPDPPPDWLSDTTDSATPGSCGYPSDDQPQAEQEALYAGLSDPARELDAEDLLPEHRLLANADELFIEANTALPNFKTGHISVQGAMGLIRRAKPKRTWIVHYSGHEDPMGPMSDLELQDWVDREKQKHGLRGNDIRVATHGMMISYTV